ncbi:hypothetical protein UFOVP200_32 [uncultured Caudovirales phage]|uniref:Uncharacterized protein n=1 Tax=uncultured Caudovirales phage TaxID=2100421 RepID=A0A6J7WQ91_9CAUD|nr:hypothetical protein UFOVP200_32 [uncultured Caudovirales phage]
MRELKKRWNSETPHFFKKVINFGIIVGIVGSGLMSLPATATIGGVLVTIGVTATAISKLTKI